MSVEITQALPGILHMPQSRRLRFRWACQAFFNVARGRPACIVAMGNGHLDHLIFDGPVVVCMVSATGKQHWDTCDGGPNAWFVRYDLEKKQWLPEDQQ